jgi:glucose/arabinose dehydrogenase
MLSCRPSLTLVCALAAIGSPLTAASWEIGLAEVAAGLDRPAALSHAGDGSGRLFVTEKVGRIRIVDGAGLRPQPFLDITGRVLANHLERGLTGLAFHPDYETNGRFYVAYTRNENGDGHSVVSEFRVSANPEVADPDSERTLLVVPQPTEIHNINQLAFGPDGTLFIASGDGGPANDPDDRGQDLGLLLGKILRIDVDSTEPPLEYAIPPDNPFVDDPLARDEIWAYGLRNPSRFSFDRASGDLFIADVGQMSWEEVDFEPAGSAGGANYGWSLMEGFHCFDPPTGCQRPGLVPPIFEYSHAEGCAVIGGAVYRGALYPWLRGTYLMGDWCTGKIFAAALQCSGLWTRELALDAPFNITLMGEDEAGEIYVVEWAVETARVFALTSTPLTTIFRADFESGNLDGWSCVETHRGGPLP